MTTDAILAALASAASFLKKPVEDVAAQAAKDIYDKAKGYLRSKFASRPDALEALTKLEEKPESEARRAVLAEEAPDLADDAELRDLIRQLLARLPGGEPPSQRVTVRGHRNKVLVAGRDLINAEKVVRKNEITPDERHITGEQKERLREVNNELAQRLAGEDGRPDYRAGFIALQKHFGVSSFALIPREKFEEALQFLKQRRAMNRGKLRSRNPAAYSGDFYRAIYSRAGELGWERPQVYQFAFEKLALKKPITSLKDLGSIQLKTLAECMQRVVRKERQSGPGLGTT